MRDGKTVIAFDAGGVLTKFPHKFRPLVNAMLCYRHFLELLVLSDQHDSAKVWEALQRNGYHFGPVQVHAANYEEYGEECKAVACEKLGVDFLIDDFPGYCAARTPGSDHVSLFVWPQPWLDYYAKDFITDGSEGNFGRRRPNRNPMKDPAGMVKPDRLGQLEKQLADAKVQIKNLLNYTAVYDADDPHLHTVRLLAELTVKEIADGKEG